MIRRHFLKLAFVIPFFPKLFRPQQSTSRIQPGFYCTFRCMKCGCTYGCNNITTCRCGSSHFTVVAVHFNDNVTIRTSCDNNVTIGAGSYVIVPEETNLSSFSFKKAASYRRGLDGKPEYMFFRNYA